MALGADRRHRHPVAALQARQLRFPGRLPAGRKPEVAVERRRRARGGEQQRAVLRGHPDPHPLDPGRRHLAGQRPAPDQAVERGRVPVETARDRFGRAPEIRRPDRFMGLLRAARPGPEPARPSRHALRWPQQGQTKPSGQRSRSSAARHCSSVPKASRNASSLRPRTRDATLNPITVTPSYGTY